MNENYGIILLAAGSSSRMGQSKQLLSVSGEPLLRRSIRVAMASGIENILVVLGSNEKGHRELVAGLPVQVISNPTWEKGIGNSLKAGVEAALLIRPALKGVVIMVCDQPLVSETHIRKLLNSHEDTKKSILASGYGQSIGVPAFFGNKYFAALLRVADTQGAKQLILENAGDVHVVDFPEGVIDLDTKEDYLKFTSQK